MFWKKKKPTEAATPRSPPPVLANRPPAAPAAPPAAAPEPSGPASSGSTGQQQAPTQPTVPSQPTVSSFSRPPAAAAASEASSTASAQQHSSSGGGGARERRNWQLHTLYVQRRFEACQRLIDLMLADANGLCEYALYVNGLIKRHCGAIDESLQLFQAAAYLNPSNALNVKQIARSLHLLGRHQAALDALSSVACLSTGTPAAASGDDDDSDDWEVWHVRGVCRWYLGEAEVAVRHLRRAIALSPHDSTYELLAKLFVGQGELRAAVDTLLEGLEFSPDSPSMLTTLGLLHLRHGDTLKALDFFSTALSATTSAAVDPRTTLAAGAIVQEHGETEAALDKYRQALLDSPHAAPVWNNVAMCYFAKRKYVACIAALKKAYGLAPFEWMIAFNLGLVHLLTAQLASAFLYFSASISLKPDFASTYMYLAICLNRLDDFENARIAYEKALSVEGDFMTELNYCIMLFNRGLVSEAKEHFDRFQTLFSALDPEAQQADPDVVHQHQLLAQSFSAMARQQQQQQQPSGRDRRSAAK
eukprot:TRINITY_DN2746_c0_g1_i5.p1 TRINITY_DN2746_c0_g1~~TRINITY_DN2746_c0_g1_i5.p1  ORF type:complete len:532 (-),score=230.39 TRINITY_DN2746_c0_g1_i5:973-2568(-)